MDAPKGRYRVVEKDGRLTVVDSEAGAPASPAQSPQSPGAAPRPPPAGLDRPPGLFDRYGRLLLSLVADRWDEDGRAILAWQWEQNGSTRRWDAALGPAEQKRMGRALAAVSAFPAFVLLTIFAGPGLIWPLLPFALASAFWGVWAIMRLKRETGAAG